MSDPNSSITIIRRIIAQIIEPKPDIGTAWCVGCVLAEGRTAVVPAADIVEHAHKHVGLENSWLKIVSRWPKGEGPDWPR